MQINVMNEQYTWLEINGQIRKLGSALVRQEEGEAISHLWGRLGVLLQRGNAALLGNRVPALPGPIDGII